MIPRMIFVSILASILGIHTYTYAIDITGREIEVCLRAEYNRSFGDCGGISGIGTIKPHDILTLRGGLFVGSLSESGDAVTAITDIKAFTSAQAAPFSAVRLRCSLLYIYNGLPYYDVHSNSILPVVSYGVSRIGLSYGPCFRFTSFFSEPSRYELINAFSVCINIINNEKRSLDATVGNYCFFYAKNMGAYSLKLNYAASVTANWTALSEVELLQSGSDALAANFYGLAWRGGAKYSW